MRLVRRLMGWMFAVACFLCVWGFGYLIVLAMRQHFFSDFHRNFASQQSSILLLILAFIVMFPVLAVVFGFAFWTTINERRAAKGWGIAASLVFVLAALWPIVHHPGSMLGFAGVELAIGAIGLYAFGRLSRVYAVAVDFPPESDPRRKA
jgi:hypothetical protein